MKTNLETIKKLFIILDEKIANLDTEAFDIVGPPSINLSDGLEAFEKELREKALEIDKPSNDYAEVCKQTRQYRVLLKEVLGDV